MTLTDCTVSDNIAGTGGGGGVTGYDVTMTDCTISGNTARSGGGGVQVYGMTLTACTISGNTANAGGGVYGVGTLTACTISGNVAAGQYATAGGMWVAYGQNPTTLTDTIIAGNTAPDGDISLDPAGPNHGAELEGSYNLIGTGGTGGLTTADHNLLNVSNPGLAPLANNGGSTQTMALLPGSPAIGAGTAPSGVTTDQRGQPLDSPPDIGAFQTQLHPMTFDVASESDLRSALLAAESDASEDIAINLTTSITLTDAAGGQLVIDNPTTIPKTIMIEGQGASPSDTVISGSGSARVVEIVGTGPASATVIFKNLSIVGGRATRRRDPGRLGGAGGRDPHRRRPGHAQ